MIRSAFIALCAVAAAALFPACEANAQPFPTRGIKIVSPHPPGVATDILGRALAQKLTDSLGVPVILENRPGANGIIAATAIAKAEPDGYTIHITTGGHIANAFVTKSLPYDVLKDFTPVTQLAASYGLALITNLPVKSVAELVALAKQKPGTLTYATNGVGNITHIAGLLFDARSGTKMIPVPYNTPNLTGDVVAGTVDMTFFSTAGATPLVTSGKIKALAVTGTRRTPGLPDVPTFKEAGVPEFDLASWTVMLAPKGTPPEIVALLRTEVLKALADPKTREALAAQGVEPSENQDVKAFLTHERDAFGRAVHELGITVGQ